MRSLAIVCLLSGVALAGELGHIDFPVTASEPARQHFVRGMMAMHSFWYDEARDELIASTQADPAFALGYWGEALTYFHPVWGQESLDKSRAALAKAKPTTERDRGLVDAARVLVGEGDKAHRWAAYRAAMKQLHARFPSDDELSMLYAVALLSSDRQGPFRPFAEAAALALDVLARNPDHPGAAHYIIHAFDDPQHAVLALPAARRYAKIAPAAFHAQHMPAHIFVQLGMWKEAQASNEAAWTASVVAAEKKHLDTSYYDLHSLEWLLAISIERGQLRYARSVLERGMDALHRSKDPDRFPLLMSRIAASYVLSTQAWDGIDAWIVSPERAQASVLASPTAQGASACHGTEAAKGAKQEAEGLGIGVRGERAAAQHDVVALKTSIAALKTFVATLSKDDAMGWRTDELGLGAHLAELTGQPKVAVASLEKALAIEEESVPSGPAGAVTARELLGELYLRQGDAKHACEMFEHSLGDHPLRSRSLLGAMRSCSDKKRYATQLLAGWSEADADLPALTEARALAGMDLRAR